MMLLHFLFHRYIEVKPVKVNLPGSWLAQETNTARAFLDDTKRYGLKTAIYNITWLWRHRYEPKPD
jgi:hypothetical protein